MDNPYQSPQEPSTPFGSGLPTDMNHRPRGLVGHVRALAILMVVQGALDLVMACFLGVMAVVIGPLMSQAEAPRAGGPPPEQMSWLVIIIYGGMAAAMLVVALLHIVAGVQNWRFRGRVLGIVALASGAFSLLTC